MENRIRLNRSMRSLISDFENNLQGQSPKYLSEKAYTSLIEFYRSQFQVDKALQAVDMAIEQFSFRAEFYNTKGKLLLMNERPEEALEVLEYASTFSPGEIELEILKALAYSQMNKFSEALDTTDRLKTKCLRDDLIDVLFCEALIYEQNRNSDKMFDALKEVLIMCPNHPEGLERVWVATELSKRYSDSIRLHEQLLNKNPYLYRAWFNLGHAYSCEGRYKEAIDALEYSFLINKDFSLAYKDCAELCMETGYVRHALSIYEDSYDQHKDDNEWLVGMGRCFYSLKKYDRAIKVARRATKLDGYDDEAWFLLAESYYQKDDLANSLRYYRKAIELEDRREEYYAGIARIYVTTEDYTKAHYYFRKATEIGPEDPAIWTEHALFLLKTEQTQFALDIIEEAEIQTYSSELMYCKAYGLLKTQQRKSGLDLFSETLQEDFNGYLLLLEVNPQFLDDDDIAAMIQYYAI